MSPVRPWGPFNFPVLCAAALVAAGLAAPAPAPAETARFPYGSLQFEPCTLAAAGQAFTVAARCARLEVPENRARPGGRHIGLAIAWVPGAAKHPAPDPVVLLAGGPGQSALEAYPLAAPAFRDVLRRRDVILIDQRGTGGSHALECPAAMEQATADEAATEPDPAAAARLAQACLAELRDADPRFYTTGDYVADLEQVRGALGVEQWNLVGVSYGTRVALDYLRRHPGNVRSVVLDAVVPPTLALGSEHARNLERAVDAQFGRCTQDAVCRARFGSPRERLDALRAHLRQHPERVQYRDPVTDELREDQLTADTVAGVVRLHAYSPQLFAMLPMLLEAAGSGRYDPLMAQARMVEQLVGEQIAMPLQLSVSCAEDAPRLRADSADAGTLLGTGFAEVLQAQCATWPRGTVPADFDAPVRSDRPVLLLSGEFDPVTPPRYGDAVRATLGNSRHLVVRGQGHGVMGVGCTPRIVGDFIARPEPARLDAQCLDAVGYVPPFTGSYGWEP